MKQEIVDYLVDNRGNIQDLLNPCIDRYYKLLKEEDSIWSSIINLEYIGTVRSIIINNVSKNTGADYVSINLVLDDMNLKEYING